MEHFLDITKDHCPMTLVKVKLKLSKIAIGDQLEVLMTDGEPLNNVPRTLKDQGHEIIKVEPDKDNLHKVIIEKRHDV
jgi:TusA-related sulfurtransferase